MSNFQNAQSLLANAVQHGRFADEPALAVSSATLAGIEETQALRKDIDGLRADLWTLTQIMREYVSLHDPVVDAEIVEDDCD